MDGKVGLAAYLSVAVFSVFLAADSSPTLLVQIISPQNTTYVQNAMSLEFAVNDSFQAAWYSIDNGSNTSLTANTTINAGEGAHLLTVFVNDSNSSTFSTSALFYVNTSNATTSNATPSPPPSQAVLRKVVQADVKPVLKRHKDTFAPGEKPSFTFSYLLPEVKAEVLPQGGAGKAALGAWASENETIQAAVFRGDEAVAMVPEIRKTAEGEFEVTLPPKRVIVPGVYRVAVTLVKDGQAFTQEEKFKWGLVAFNTLKSIYRPGETAEFEIIVLDAAGAGVCGANVALQVTSPDGSVSEYLTATGTVLPGAECGLYKALHATSVEGNYSASVQAETLSVNASFKSFFLVKSSYEFDVVRKAETKIDPTRFSSFHVTISVSPFTASADTVLLTERVPSFFTIVAAGADVIAEGETTRLVWQKAVVGGQAAASYSYAVPMEWPKLYALGEATVEYAGGTFQEARPWFVAVDPMKRFYTNSSQTYASTTSTDYTLRMPLAFTAPEAGTSYLTIASAEFNATNLESSVDNQLRLLIDGTWWAHFNHSVAAEGNTESSFTISNASMTAGAHNIRWEYLGSASSPTAMKHAAITSFNTNSIQVYYNQTANSEAGLGETSTTWRTMLNLWVQPPDTGDYLVLATGEQLSRSATAYVGARLVIGGVTDATIIRQVKTAKDWHGFAFSKVTNLTAGAKHSIEVQDWENARAANENIRRLRVAVIRLTGYLEYYNASNETNLSTTSTTFQDAAVLNFNAPNATNYTVVATAQYNASSTSVPAEVRLTVDDTEYALSSYTTMSPLTNGPFAAHITLPLSAGSHTAKIQYRTAGTGAVNISNARLTVFLANWDNVPPTNLTTGANSTAPATGENVDFYSRWTDNVNLSHHVFSWNASGANCDTWANSSAVWFSNGNGNWTNTTQTIPAACSGKRIGFVFYANDSSKNWNNNGNWTVDVQAPSCVISLNQSSLSFGSVSPFNYSGEYNTTLTNTGSVAGNVFINGSDWTGASGSMWTNRTEYYGGSVTAWKNLTTSQYQVYTSLPASDWFETRKRVFIPSAQAAGSYSQTITYAISC